MSERTQFIFFEVEEEGLNSTHFVVKLKIRNFCEYFFIETKFLTKIVWSWATSGSLPQCAKQRILKVNYDFVEHLLSLLRSNFLKPSTTIQN